MSLTYPIESIELLYEILRQATCYSSTVPFRLPLLPRVGGSSTLSHRFTFEAPLIQVCDQMWSAKALPSVGSQGENRCACRRAHTARASARIASVAS